jgi:hypothetical protein
LDLWALLERWWCGWRIAQPTRAPSSKDAFRCRQEPVEANSEQALETQRLKKAAFVGAGFVYVNITARSQLLGVLGIVVRETELIERNALKDRALNGLAFLGCYAVRVLSNDRSDNLLGLLEFERAEPVFVQGPTLLKTAHRGAVVEFGEAACVHGPIIAL